MKHSVQFLAVLLILTMLLSACQQVSTPDSTSALPPGDTTAVPTVATTQSSTESTEPVVITALMGNDNTPSEDNAVLEAILERTGIIFKPTVVPGADVATKLSTMIASETLPDIFGFSFADGTDFRDNGLILEISSLLKDFAPNIIENKSGAGLFEGLNTEKEVYGIPRGFTNSPCVVTIRTDWLDNLDLEMPTDLDSYYDVLHAFTYDDPDKDGIDNTVGLCIGMSVSARFQNIFAAWGIPQDQNIQLEDGTVTSYLLHPNYVEAITFINKLYHDGVMEQEFATIPTMTLLEKFWNGQAGVWHGNATATTQNWLGRYTEDPIPTFDFTTIYGPDGLGGCLEIHNTNYVGVSSQCEHPEQAIKLLDFYVSYEGEELLYLGIEGEFFKWLDTEKTQYEFMEPYTDSAVHRSAGGYVYYELLQRNNDGIVSRAVTPTTARGILLGQQTVIPDAFIYTPLEASKEYGETLNGIVNEALALLIITDPANIEEEYQQFVQRWLAEGGEEYQEEATRVYAEENK